MQCVADNSGHASRVCARGGKRDVSLTSRLLEWASVLESGSLTRSLAPLTVFQKLSIVDAIVAETDAANCCMEPEAFRHLLPSLIASAACNRSTRIVVYFRGDDIKLMQNNVRESSEYMMHTHVTTPPVERSTLCSLAHMPEQRKQYGGLLIAAWMASISFFFRSFCMEESWTTFAQEQRRMVWLREQETRRQQRQRKRHDSSSLGNAQGEPISSAASERSGSATSGVGVAKRGENCKPADFENDDDGNNFDDESAVSRFTSLSRMSRASLISTFSKPSMASYHSFLSVIDAANHEGKNAETSLYLHQSEDDNTNLPLILLEEVTLALQNFIAAVDGAGVGSLLLDELGLRSLAWRVIGELFTFIQNTTTASGCAQGNIRGGTSGSTATAGGLPIVFHLGNDLRYNKGMGYEILGLLFAKVVLPQLLTSSTTNNTQSCYFVERASLAVSLPMR
ncbi:hypothetical protein ERJ75_001463100 [Trypanosoma vivax]|nr:hypothetical protein ERJ75_001463100 [Trypanosoma vivax]